DLACIDALATGHRLYGRARQEFLADRLGATAETMSRTGAAFASASSAYALWPPIYRTIVLWTDQSPQETLGELSSTSTAIDATSSTYFNLRDRYHWTAGTALAMSGRSDVARERWQSAVDLYTRAGEWESLSASLMGVAETE